MLPRLSHTIPLDQNKIQCRGCVSIDPSSLSNIDALWAIAYHSRSRGYKGVDTKEDSEEHTHILGEGCS